MLGRAKLWPRFVTVWNWCNVLQYLALVVATAGCFQPLYGDHSFTSAPGMGAPSRLSTRPALSARASSRSN